MLFDRLVTSVSLPTIMGIHSILSGVVQRCAPSSLQPFV